MSGLPVFARTVRLLMLALLLCGFVVKPALAFGEEIHDLTAHAAAQGGHADHDLGRAPAPDKDQPGHDDGWHVSHCCGHQAAMLPRLDVDAFARAQAAPVRERFVAFTPSPLTAPFRPPIAA